MNAIGMLRELLNEAHTERNHRGRCSNGSRICGRQSKRTRYRWAVSRQSTCAARGSRSPTSAARTTRSMMRARMSSARLPKGDLAGTTVTCMCHGAEFDVRTGKVLAPPATLPVKVYRIRIEGDALQIEV